MEAVGQAGMFSLKREDSQADKNPDGAPDKSGKQIQGSTMSRLEGKVAVVSGVSNV